MNDRSRRREPKDDTPDATDSFAAPGKETSAPQLVEKRALEAEMGASGLAGQFGRYRIIRPLGKGGMASVYLAVDTHIERLVALKTPHFTKDPTGEQTKRFFREARSAGNLRHPNICPIYDFGEIDGKHFITMAYIEGYPLSALVKADKPQTERQILTVIRKLALALQAAHDKGIVHRDMKPANVMVDTSGEPIIMDFGLARQASWGDPIRLTQPGNILGTPRFMSPEQVHGQPDKIGPATDQFSLGVMLYELLTGQLPFHGSVTEVLRQILTKEPRRPSELRREMDPRVETVCLKMMAKTPAERFASLKAVADELTAILDSPALKAASQAKPGDDRAARARREIPEQDLGFSKEDKARVGILNQFHRPLNDGGWIAWSVLALGLAVFGAMAAVVAGYVGRNGNSQPVARLDTGIGPSTSGPTPKAPSSTAGGKKRLPPPKPSQEENTTAGPPPTFKNNLGMEFVLVPTGKSWLGGGGGSPGQQEVVIAHDFYLGKYEVTQEEWEKVTGLTPSWFSRTGGGKDLVKDIPDAELRRFPVENVAWDDLRVFLDRLNQAEKAAGWVYRLPTAAEWEYACRGGPLSDRSQSAYDFYFDTATNRLLPEQSNSWHREYLQRTCKVGSYRPNRLGLYDMHGNVWEWSNDVEAPRNWTPSRVPLGGGWSTNPVSCTAAYHGGPARWEGRVGVRVARSSGE